MRILFVCLGNICRSPTALAATREALAATGLADHVELDSAGLGAWHVGYPPDRRMTAAAREDGLVLDGSARTVSAGELDRWDLVLAMDHDNRRRLLEMAETDDLRARIRMFREFDEGADGAEVPDPYRGGDEGFHRVVAMCRAAAAGLADHIADVVRARP